MCKNESSEYFRYEKRNDQENENLTWSSFVNFRNFSELTLDCNQTYNITDYLAMRSKVPFLIDKNFRLSKIINQSQLNSIKS